MPRFGRIYDESAGAFEMLAIHWNINKQDLERWMTKNDRHYNFPIAIDTSTSVSMEYLIEDTPTLFFVDRAGIIRAWHNGVWGMVGEEKFREYLKTIL